jgi:hypothetical protein
MFRKIGMFFKRVVVPCIIFVAVVAFVGFILNAAEMDGYIPHASTSPVLYPARGWEIGQYVRCAIATPTNEEPYLECNDGDMKAELMRRMDVTIWGHVTKKPVYFLCKRSDSSISCHLERL